MELIEDNKFPPIPCGKRKNVFLVRLFSVPHGNTRSSATMMMVIMMIALEMIRIFTCKSAERKKAPCVADLVTHQARRSSNEMEIK